MSAVSVWFWEMKLTRKAVCWYLPLMSTCQILFWVSSDSPLLKVFVSFYLFIYTLNIYISLKLLYILIIYKGVTFSLFPFNIINYFLNIYAFISQFNQKFPSLLSSYSFHTFPLPHSLQYTPLSVLNWTDFPETSTKHGLSSCSKTKHHLL